MGTRKKRAPGTGSIIFTRGAYRARLPKQLGRGWLKPESTYEEAERALDAMVLAYQTEGILPTEAGPSWSTVAEKWLGQQPAHNLRGYGGAVKRVRRYDWSHYPIDTVVRADLLRWVDERRGTVARSTLRLDASVVSMVFAWAVDREMCHANPATRIRLGKRLTDDHAWTYLTRDELEAVLRSPAVLLRDRLIVAFWVGTGLRPGEWRSLRLDDVTDAGVRVRIGTETSRGTGPTKGRRIRRIPWIPIARRAWLAWQAYLPEHAHRNPRKLAFPGPLGGKYDRWTQLHLRQALAAAGIVRPFRPHDLRHTCGAALASGYFGHALRLELVRDFLGHAHISETERYGHLAPGSLEAETGALTDLIGHNPALIGHTNDKDT